MVLPFSNSASTRVRRDSGDYYFCELSENNQDTVTMLIGSEIIPLLDELESAYVSKYIIQSAAYAGSF